METPGPTLKKPSFQHPYTRKSTKTTTDIGVNSATSKTPPGRFLLKKITPRADHRFPLQDLDLSRQIHFMICTWYGLAHVAGWEPYQPALSICGRTCFLGLDLSVLQQCVHKKILHSLSQRQVKKNCVDRCNCRSRSVDHDLSKACILFFISPKDGGHADHYTGHVPREQGGGCLKPSEDRDHLSRG